MWDKIVKWWYFKVNNPIVRDGQSKDGAFKWRFRRFSMEISTLSENFKAQFTAGEHPYGYLVSGKTDDNILGYCQTLYEVAMLLTTDQGFVNDIQKALRKYSSRIEKNVKVEEDEVKEKIALETEKAIEEYTQMPKRFRKKVDRDTDRKFKKAVKAIEDEEAGS